MLPPPRFIYQVRFSSTLMFIQTEDTPNPATLKFIPGREVMGVGAVADFPSADTAGRSCSDRVASFIEGRRVSR